MAVFYRLTRADYAPTAFRGSRRWGRWHRLGTPLVYAADTPATALLETLAHAERATLLARPYVVFRIECPDAHLIRLAPADLPADWRAWPWPRSTQALGTFWFTRQASVVLEVPSAVVPHQRNYLVNPYHPDFARLAIGPPEPFDIDPRLGR